MHDFVHSAAKTLADAGLIRVFVLRSQDGEPLAATLVYVCRDHMFGFQTGFDPQWERHRVGTVLLALLLQHASEQGYARFDFLGDEAQYKAYWSNETHGKTDVLLFPNTASGVWRAAKTKWLLDARRTARRIAGRDRRTHWRRQVTQLLTGLRPGAGSRKERKGDKLV
jgi:CelD/BcsL family acetyltransferase involved in cellulose biosynthesis